MFFYVIWSLFMSSLGLVVSLIMPVKGLALGCDHHFFDLGTNAELETMECKVFEYLKGSWCSEEKAKLVMELFVVERPRTCVEIGTFTGSSALPMLVALAYNQAGHAYLIDAWSTLEAVKGMNPKDPSAIWWSSLDMKMMKRKLLCMLAQWGLGSYNSVICASSKEAASKIDFDIDFLHLDGNFSEEGALLDTQLYLPKVKIGGYILLSNVLFMMDRKPTKTKALCSLFHQCEIVEEVDSGNTILFKKLSNL